jgi:hypothetical protein
VQYKNIYTPIPSQDIAVIAGLVPVDDLLAVLPIALGSIIPVDDADALVVALSYGLLLDTRFATPISPLKCSGRNCTSFFLPGGVELARPIDHQSTTLFGTQVWDDSTAIVIYQAPGYQVEFSPIENGFKFNTTTDCHTHGLTVGDGLYICIASHENKLVAGEQIDC